MDAITKSRFLTLYCMILADGVIDAKELEKLYEIAHKHYGLSESEVSEAVRDSGTSFLLPKLIDDKVALLYEMTQIAWADGHVDDDEKKLLLKYALKMGFLESNVEAIVDYLMESVKNGKTIKDVIDEIKNC